MVEINEWRKSYDAVVAKPPEPGDIITGPDGSKIKLEIQFREGFEPFIYARIYVPQIVGSECKWIAHGVDDVDKNFGWKLILSFRSRNALIKRFGLSSDTLLVDKIQIIRRSLTDRSFVGEVIN